MPLASAGKLRNVRIPALRQFSVDKLAEFAGEFRILLLVGSKFRVPFRFGFTSTVDGLAKMLLGFLWARETAARRANPDSVSSASPLPRPAASHARRRCPACGANHNQCASVPGSARDVLFPGARADGVVDSIQVIAILDGLCVPAIRREPLGMVFGEGELRRGGESDAVVIVEIDQLPEFQVARERSGFGCHALHQIAIADQSVGEMIDDLKPGRL